MRSSKLSCSLSTVDTPAYPRTAGKCRYRLPPNGKKQSLAAVLVSLTLVAASSGAQAKILISVDKDAQAMTVAIDGVQLYQWPVSTGTPSHETPTGSFRAFRLEEDHYSKEFDDAPMPHAIFFTKSGHAIHGTDSVNRLGSPASHGCVRLSRDNASTLFTLVKNEGVLDTTVALSGSSQVALARNAHTKRDTAIARSAIAPVSPSDAANNPAELVVETIVPRHERQRQIQPTQVDRQYIHPDDGNFIEQRSPPPHGYRRVNEAPTSPPQHQHSGNRRQAQQPASRYMPQPYYPPRGFFTFQD